MGYEAVPGALRAAGGSAGGAVDAIQGADCGAPVRGVAEALPGSTAGPAATAFAGAWSQFWKSWTEQARGHAQTLSDAADTYRATEQEQAQRVPGGGG